MSPDGIRQSVFTRLDAMPEVLGAYVVSGLNNPSEIVAQVHVTVSSSLGARLQR